MNRYFAAAIALALGLLGIPLAYPGSLPFPGPGRAALFAFFDPATLTAGSLSDGNRTLSGSVAAVVRTTRFVATKFYAEISINTLTSGSGNVGIGAVDSAQSTVTPTSIVTVPAGFWLDRNDALKINNGVSAAYGANYGAVAVYGIAIDNTLGSGSGLIWVGPCVAGTVTWPSAGDPTTGANPMYSNLTGNIGIVINSFAAVAFSISGNFGATAYACAAPSGYGNL